MGHFLCKSTVLICFLLGFACGSEAQKTQPDSKEAYQILPAAYQTADYLPKLQGKKVAIVANQTSGIYNGNTIERFAGSNKKGDSIFIKVPAQTHLVDSLLSSGIEVVQVFAPEHGFRGRKDAGEKVSDGKDLKTGLPILSLHGKNRKPTAKQLAGVDIIVFDIQDVGVRFYTYISTMSLVMEAAAQAGIPVIVLDRPNPNGHYVDGPTMLPEHTSFLGMHPIPLVYGMTIGEYATMVNGEGWLKDGKKCDLTVIKMVAYKRSEIHSMVTRPSPNLPNDTAIQLYPSLGLLEGTNLNAGRGTEMQFQLLGSPYLPADKYSFTYTPQPNFGSKYPKHQNTECNGLNLQDIERMDRVDLKWLVRAYRDHAKKDKFFNTKNFTAHAGTPLLQQQIMQGLSADEIRASWQPEIEAFKIIRAKYLLYE